MIASYNISQSRCKERGREGGQRQRSCVYWITPMTDNSLMQGPELSHPDCCLSPHKTSKGNAMKPAIYYWMGAECMSWSSNSRTSLLCNGVCVWWERAIEKKTSVDSMASRLKHLVSHTHLLYLLNIVKGEKTFAWSKKGIWNFENLFSSMSCRGFERLPLPSPSHRGRQGE